MSKAMAITKYIYISLLALVALLALVVIVSSSSILGHRLFVVRTGSMAPDIPAGSLIYDHRQSSYKVGDAITFIEPGSISSSPSDLVTHRIVSIKKEGVVTYYQVKGDANKTPDVNLVPSGNVIGTVRYSVPKIGYVVSFIKSLPGIIILIIVPATIIVYEELGKIKNEVIKLRKEAKKLKGEVIEESKEIEQEVIQEIHSVKKSVARKKKPTKKISI